MGVSMCSQMCNRTVGNIYDFQRTEGWYTSDEDSADDEAGYSNSAVVEKSILMPPDLRRILGEASAIKRAKNGQLSKSSGCSLPERMRDRRRSLVVDREMEDNARQYSKFVAEDSLKHLRRTIRVAGSIAEKGSDINKELARQERAMFRAESDVKITEYETDEVNGVLKGMSSLRGKLATVIWKKKPKLRVNPSRQMDIAMINGEVGLFSFSRMIPSKSATEDTQQNQLKEGFGHLHHALDVITIQQMDAAWALDRHEERLSVFEDQITTTHHKINCQSRLIKQIIGKSQV